ncbi:site-2 protease family protein [candidate division WWE3 bacterium CG_4_9_14_0_2_um_filter_35_11]|uniref:Site-2 protease family protein n=1 Tax=candidate division WWE3 bacterium CG_4_9_14_0_2_um_filter_35_11 TaxID=1975077 RepID=A0A2M8EMA0_UNCKA|nr:MAG: site-2 protease family protein [candidate division WWE3 bacterium CG10_big_fil_rev_8_21_14_0_10_35_32]PJC23807.1 MAG: site-2 protease family protein [candidate division WWE3 bacterium CG_4_9_14_0_2_um_filter_35_11]
MIFSLFVSDPILGLALLASIILAITIHEAAHAFMAVKLGDDTPKAQGRLTLNPLSHLDPWGTLLIVFAGIGWGKPVMFNPFNLKNLRRDTALVALAGPVSNFIMAFAVSMLLRVSLISDIKFVYLLLQNFAFLNIVLGVFNLIPIEPLDGYKVVSGILPPYLALQWEETKKYGLTVLVLLLLTGSIEKIVFPLASSIANLLF